VFDTNVPNDFVDALSNDLGTPQAFFRLSELASATTVSASDLAGSEAGYADIDGDPVLTEIALQAAAELKAALLFLGFSFEESLLSDQEIVEAVDARLAFIAAKNWAEADRIRDELLAKGIQLKDGKDPETGERVTTWEVRR
jgi:cysteinyl-tRNA synthetase